MIFGRSSQQTALNLNAGEVDAIDPGVGIFTASKTNLKTEDKVKEYFEQFREPVFRYLTATFGEPVQAEEITQEAFFSLNRCMNEGQAIQNVRAWVFRVAHNMAINQIKSRQFIAPIGDDEWNELEHSLLH